MKLDDGLLAVLLVRGSILLDLEHDPAVAVLAPARGRGDEARRRHRLVHPLAVHDRGRRPRRARRRRWRSCCSRRQDRASSIRSTSDFSLIAAPQTIDFGLLVAVLLGARVGVSARGLGPVAAPLPARLSAARGPTLCGVRRRRLAAPASLALAGAPRSSSSGRHLDRRAPGLAARPGPRRARRRPGHARRRRGDRRRPGPTTARSPTASSPTPRSPASWPSSTTASRTTSIAAEYRRFQETTGQRSSPAWGSRSPANARSARKRRLRRLAGAPRAACGAGDLDRRRRRALAARVVQQTPSAAIKGRPGTTVRLRGAAAGADTRDAQALDVRGSRRRLAAAQQCTEARSASSRSSRSAPAPTASFDEALRKLRKRGAKAYVLDLRGNGGGLVSEAQLVASAFLPDGPIVTTRGRAVPDADAAGRPASRSCPRPRWSCWSTANGVGLGDRHGRAAGPPARRRWSARARSARASSRRSSSCPTAARSTSPPASTSRRRAATSAVGASARGSGITPDVRARDDPKTKRDEALPVALRGRAGAASR